MYLVFFSQQGWKWKIHAIYHYVGYWVQKNTKTKINIFVKQNFTDTRVKPGIYTHTYIHIYLVFINISIFE